MKSALLALLLWPAIACFAAKSPLVDDDQASLMQRATAFVAAYRERDAEKYAAMTHSSIFRLLPDRSLLVPSIRRGMERIHALGIVTEAYTLFPPTECETAETEIVCFVPRKIVTVLDGKREEELSYLLAGRAASNAGAWYFLDSDGFRNSPQRLYELFPDLPRTVKAPAISVLSPR